MVVVCVHHADRLCWDVCFSRSSLATHLIQAIQMLGSARLAVGMMCSATRCTCVRRAPPTIESLNHGMKLRIYVYVCVCIVTHIPFFLLCSP
jgi:hypothetical protein